MKPVLKFIYEYITSLFSGVVRQYITYKQDNTATEYRDYIGIVQPNAYQAFADCEDIAQIGHDLVKIFRRLYPDINIHTRMTEHLPHISYWLKQCDVYMVQGSVGSAQDTFLQSHVWTMICPTKILDAIGIDAGSFIIETYTLRPNVEVSLRCFGAAPGPPPPLPSPSSCSLFLL